MLTLHEDRERAIIDWGDGTQEEIYESDEALHTYARTGEYEVRISDEITGIRFGGGSEGEYSTLYAPMIESFSSNARRMETLNARCFFNARNMVAFSCEGSSVNSVASRSFVNCESLIGRIDLHGVQSLAVDSFENCPGITELHFAKASEGTITALDGFGVKFGATNATIAFDL